MKVYWAKLPKLNIKDSKKKIINKSKLFNFKNWNSKLIYDRSFSSSTSTKKKNCILTKKKKAIAASTNISKQQLKSLANNTFIANIKKSIW